MLWSESRIAEARLLVSSVTLSEAAAQLSQRWGETVTKVSLRSALRRAPDNRDTVRGMSPAPKIEAELEEEVPLEDLRAAHVERSRVSSLNASNARLLRELESKDEQIRILTELQSAPPPIKVRPSFFSTTQRKGTPVMLLSDLHVEERVDPEKVLGLNCYNLDIAEKCLEEAADAFVWLTKDARYDCRDAVIAILGDTFSGYIHAELQETNFLAPTEAGLWLLPRLEGLLLHIADELPSLERIIVVCNDGNHGRLTPKMRVSTRTENSLEWFMYHTLASRMAGDSRFEFQIADGAWNDLQIYSSNFAFTHGDTFRYQGGVGGLLIPVRRGVNEQRKYRKVDHVCMGHFHTRTDDGGIIVNGSMIGVTPYSLANNFPPEPRQQSWFMVDSEHGKCLSAPIWLPLYKNS